MEMKKYLPVIGIVLWCFFLIPIKVNKSFDENTEILFKNYIIKFNKTYNKNDTEYFVRFKNFRKSLKLIEILNQNRTTNETALYGLTLFSDLSQDEFIKTRLQTNTTKLTQNYSKYNSLESNSLYTPVSEGISKFTGSKSKMKRSTSLPIKVDWREKGIIGKVHNQKNCGACWAFSTIETLESMNALKVGSLVELSVQQAIDCAGNNYGCEGGDSSALLSWLVATKTKITTEKLYPFTYKTGFCKIIKSKTGVQVQSFSCDNFDKAEDLLLKKLAFHGPVAAAVNALNWQYYLGGIIKFHCAGAVENLNHAVQIVGYDRSGPVPYYIARNSWGTEFGDNGYIYIAIGGNLCGLANEVTSLDVL